ncbi:hypothetical protein [Streptomyces sp. HNA39]|uniref:hypothetical protein n=1 Tax=Streptomyces sp. HNA39 TaxID=2850561 RepID=UPI00200E2236|nr:hypothetical protein [Streptomyces sp. HNA39]UQA36072.1 hypothetical protein KRR37_21965 [Streptomyces sp. HNA39]
MTQGFGAATSQLAGLTVVGLLAEQAIAYDRPTAGSQARADQGAGPQHPSPGSPRAVADFASGGE